MKKKIIVAIVAIIIVACVSATFAVWLGNVNKKQTYTIQMSDNFMYISSQDLELASGDKLLPGAPVTHKFNLKLKGSNAVVKLECLDIQFMPVGSTKYQPVAKDAVAVSFDKNNIDVNHGDTKYEFVECRSTIEFLLPATELDIKYENAKFKYTIKVSIAEKEAVNG